MGLIGGGSRSDRCLPDVQVDRELRGERQEPAAPGQPPTIPESSRWATEPAVHACSCVDASGRC